MTTVDVVVPVYNEEVALPRNIPILSDFLAGPDFPYDWRIIIADNGSTDGTPGVARALEAQFPGQVAYYLASGRGKGRAIYESWMASTADVVSFMDADLATGLDAFPALIGAITHEGFDIAIGSRLHPASRVTRSLKRRFLTRSYNVLVRALLQASWGDAQCGFKAARRSTAQAVLPAVKDLRWFFDTEFLVIASRAGYRIKEVPVSWLEDERTSVGIVSTIASDLGGLVRLRLTRPWRRLKPAPGRRSS